MAQVASRREISKANTSVSALEKPNDPSPKSNDSESGKIMPPQGASIAEVSIPRSNTMETGNTSTCSTEEKKCIAINTINRKNSIDNGIVKDEEEGAKFLKMTGVTVANKAAMETLEKQKRKGKELELLAKERDRLTKDRAAQKLKFENELEEEEKKKCKNLGIMHSAKSPSTVARIVDADGDGVKAGWRLP